ncbi:MAG: hypothetical protein OS130_14960 [Thermodesulfobacteriota bacterium]|jgi:hypothetical protein|nr:MAG: hypothetical protein OS130_14960 [Thermodesulfobacteriota bacterium]
MKGKENKEIIADDDYKPHFDKIHQVLKKMHITILSDGIIWHTNYIKGISELLYYAFEREEIEGKISTGVFLTW